MGLLRASIIFIIGNFSISIPDNHLDLIDKIPVVGQIFGENMKKFVKENKTMALLIIITLFEFII